MYAIIETGGKQYRVSAGQVINVDRIDANPGAPLSIDRVLFLSKEGTTVTGTPYIEGATVKASVVETAKNRKVIVFKMKPRKGYRRLRGHRQYFTKIKIDDIVYGG
ncbi:MAG TPA: 50S ribosomal protein L21 [Nitrospirae bacterium]|nr:50S ribosomal protein L21 [Nitrospirota bacterium]